MRNLIGSSVHQSNTQSTTPMNIPSDVFLTQ
jgi:hypothetical protein